MNLLSSLGGLEKQEASAPGLPLLGWHMPSFSLGLKLSSAYLLMPRTLTWGIWEERGSPQCSRVSIFGELGSTVWSHSMLRILSNVLVSCKPSVMIWGMFVPTWPCGLRTCHEAAQQPGGKEKIRKRVDPPLPFNLRLDLTSYRPHHLPAAPTQGPNPQYTGIWGTLELQTLDQVCAQNIPHQLSPAC